MAPNKEPCTCIAFVFFVHARHQHEAGLENIYVLSHTVSLVLRDALRDPHDVTDLLLLKLDIRIIHAIMELLFERKPVEIDLKLEELVLD